MRILIASHSAGWAGAERALAELVRCLLRHGFSVHVIFPKPGPLLDELSTAGAATSILPLPYWITPDRSRWLAKRWRRGIRATIRLQGLIRRWRPDLVITNTLVIPWAAFAARLAGRKHLWFVHELGDRGLHWQFDLGKTLTYKLAGWLAEILIAPSLHVARGLLDASPRAQVEVLPCPVDVPTRSNSEIVAHGDGALELLFAGRLTPEKGIEDALVAASQLVHRGVSFRLRVAGLGAPSYEQALRRMVSDLGIDQQVHFLGFVDPLWKDLRTADVCVMCSRAEEAFGRVTIEAMKQGCAVVGASTGATTELIKDGETGLLYTPGSPLELASKLELLARDRALLRKLRLNALTWSQRSFEPAAFCTRLLELVAERGSGAS